MGNEIFLLIEKQEDYQCIYGTYTDYLKCEQDYFNLKKNDF